MNTLSKKEGYKKVLQIIKKYELDELHKVECLAEKGILAADIKEKYHVDVAIDSMNTNNGIWCSVHVLLGNMYIGHFGSKYNRDVTNNKQDCDNELLVHLRFPTGAYVFGEDYPVDFFNRFWEELLSYNPKYVDSANHGLYFSIGNAAAFIDNYGAICMKYSKQNNVNMKMRRIAALRKEADQLAVSLNREGGAVN